MTQTLTEFLLARIDEDKARADDAWKAVANGAVVWDRIHPDARAALWTPERVLAECEAKRRIVDYREQCERDRDEAPREARDLFAARLLAFDATLRALALPYADHPDYDETWRP